MIGSEGRRQRSLWSVATALLPRGADDVANRDLRPWRSTRCRAASVAAVEVCSARRIYWVLWSDSPEAELIGDMKRDRHIGARSGTVESVTELVAQVEAEGVVECVDEVPAPRLVHPTLQVVEQGAELSHASEPQALWVLDHDDLGSLHLAATLCSRRSRTSSGGGGVSGGH